MQGAEDVECVICYDVVAKSGEESHESRSEIIQRPSNICARCNICESCVGAWIKKRCLSSSEDTDIRCPGCMTTVDPSVWLGCLDRDTLAFLEQKFVEQYQIVCDEGCVCEFSLWRTACENLEEETRKLMDFMKSRGIPVDTRTNFVKTCRKFGKGKVSAEEVVQELEVLFNEDEFMLAEVVWSGWGTGVSFPQIIRNPMKRARFLDAYLNKYTRINCRDCGSEICFRCWRTYHGAGNTCHRVRMRECPQCGVMIERVGGSPHLVCTLCSHSFYWHDGMYHEEEDYFNEEYYGQES